MSNKPIVTRVAPSPTGLFHIGTARVALFNYLFTHQNNGKMIFRIDDTDTERSKPEYTEDILNSMAWLGLKYDDIFYQSKRTAIYREKLEELMTAGKIYLSKEVVEKEGDREEVIRFKNPNIKISFDDLIRGHIEFDTTELGDFVVAKDLDTPLYHFASVVDDHLLGVTHVIRGEDHISNTPRQILMLEALGGERPTYAHLPIILAPDKTKLSKRKHGAIASVSEYQKLGYLPEAVINFVAMIGWSPQSSQEDADRNEDLLTMLNREYLKKLSATEFKNKVLEFLPDSFKARPEYNEAILDRILPIILDRISRLGEIADLAESGELGYFFVAPRPSKEILKTPEQLAEVVNILSTVSEADFTSEKIKAAVWDYATATGRGAVLWPMRVALSGREKSPDPFTLAMILGKAETLSRLTYASKL